MTLKSYCFATKGEIEVWDKEVDIATPYYNYDGEFTYGEEDHYLHMVEEWLLFLNVEVIDERVVNVDTFVEIKNNFNADDYDTADIVEGVFECLAVGDRRFAKRFCEVMGFVFDPHDIAERFEAGKIRTVTIDSYPDCDKIEFEEIDELATDLSQGTGNAVRRYFYIPALDILCVYCDY